MKVADLVRDAALLPTIQILATEIHANYPAQAEQLMQRWLPQGERFAQV